MTPPFLPLLSREAGTCSTARRSGLFGWLLDVEAPAQRTLMFVGLLFEGQPALVTRILLFCHDPVIRFFLNGDYYKRANALLQLCCVTGILPVRRQSRSNSETRKKVPVQDEPRDHEEDY